MDTDELSKETYRAIIIEAEKFHHDLTLQFGLHLMIATMKRNLLINLWY